MNLVIVSFVLDLTTCEIRKHQISQAVGCETRTGRCIDDQQECGHQGEENDGRAEDRPGGPTLDQGCDEDCTNTLSSLVESLSSSHWRRRVLAGGGSKGSDTDAILHTLCEGAVLRESIRGKSCNGSVEEFEA